MSHKALPSANRIRVPQRLPSPLGKVRFGGVARSGRTVQFGENRRRRIRPSGIVRSLPAILACLVITAWPLFVPDCCCQGDACITVQSQAIQSQAAQSSATQPRAAQTETAPTTQALPACCACTSTEVVESPTCDKHECPCELQQWELDPVVVATSTPLLKPKTPISLASFMGTPWLAGVPVRSLAKADSSRSFSITSNDRCALLCRWLN